MPPVMDLPDQRPKREDDDRSNLLSTTNPSGSYPNKIHPGQPADAGVDGIPSGYTLMVAGQRTGKTSFLRLLLDTSDISLMATKEQLASVARFVQGSCAHTSHIRTASIDIDFDVHGDGVQQRLSLTLVDTPSLDFEDESSSERLVLDMLRHVDSRFAEGVEDDWKAQTGDHHVHLCIYFLDPDKIVPPSVPGPPAPLISRARTNSFSQPEQDPVILEPPVTTNPLLYRPTLPAAEINTIRRLSARVNVLPVVARADTLTNDRLTAVKKAIRRDLADAGIGFGIFDVDNHYQHTSDEQSSAPATNGEPGNGYNTIPNGTSSAHSSPPISPITPPHLRLPYALISPDIYSHSDGVTRIPPSRHELFQQYTPSSHAHAQPSKIVRSKYIRNYRWGFMDILDPNHCDFLPLRAAIFHHMETLQKYTREYLFDKFRIEYQLQQHATSHHSLQHHIAQGITTHAQVPPLSHGSRPILAIDTAPTHTAVHLHPSLSRPAEVALGGDMRPTSVVRTALDPVPPNMSSKTPSSQRSSKQRTKKITVACNFCRSRKLKCDGGRPACSQCVKRSNPCDYMPQNNRRGTLRQRRGDDSESDSGEDRSAELDEPSMSPEVASQPLSRRSSNVDRLHKELISGPSERREDPPPPPPPPLLSQQPQSRPKIVSRSSPVEPRSLFKDNELPHIATLSLPEASPTTPMSAPTLPPIRPASELQAAQRKRAATVPGKSIRQASSSGPKVVACNFCRARKTKCDGAHPACSSCARRSLPCNYVHDAGVGNGSTQKKASRRGSTSKPAAQGASHSPASSSLASHSVPPQSSGKYGDVNDTSGEGEIELKRTLEESEGSRPLKKMRMEDTAIVVGIP